MTPTPDSSENRRSFVKKTLATTVTISFAGLIRAHGEESGGTTTWNPDVATVETTDSGGTTTWNPDETTAVTSEGGETTTWNPDETTSEESTYETTPKVCEWVKKMDVVFDKIVEFPKTDRDEDQDNKSGRIFAGAMKVTMIDCLGRERVLPDFAVETGGYLAGNPPPLKKGSDTGCPEGNHRVNRKSQIVNSPKGKFDIPEGHVVSGDGLAPRTAILVHGPIRDPGSSGCIVITGEGRFEEWSNLMGKTRCGDRSGCNSVGYPSPVAVSVTYERNVKPINTILND